MNDEEIQHIADENNFDVKVLADSHYRFLDEYGMYKFDVYFKHDKKGNVKWNTILKWETGQWSKITTREEFLKLI